MSDPVIIRVVRPYATAEEFLDAESPTIDKRGMLLIDADPLAPDTLVRFVVSLETGESLIKAEGRVKSYIAGGGGIPGGLMVRFKRFGGVTKQFIDRAVSHRIASRRPPPADSDVESSRQPTQITETELSAPDAAPPPPPLTDAVAPGGEFSGVRARSGQDFAVPANRDELLARLRERASRLTDEKIALLSKRVRAG